MRDNDLRFTLHVDVPHTSNAHSFTKCSVRLCFTTAHQVWSVGQSLVGSLVRVVGLSNLAIVLFAWAACTLHLSSNANHVASQLIGGETVPGEATVDGTDSLECDWMAARASIYQDLCDPLQLLGAKCAAAISSWTLALALDPRFATSKMLLQGRFVNETTSGRDWQEF